MSSEPLSKTGELLNLLKRVEGIHILIIGDIMLDEHIWTDIHRISPEAPVQVAEVQRITRTGGGAANVATNVRGLGAVVYLAGVIGSDDYAGHLTKLLQDIGIDISGVVADAERPTTVKTRVIARGQHVVRIDRETAAPIPQKLEKQLREFVSEQLPSVDALILSDYGKGVMTPSLCQAVIKKAGQLGKPIIVDPKGKDYRKYRGATVITPNEKEAEIAANMEIRDDETLERVSRQILQVTQARWVLVTRGAKGITLFSEDLKHHIPAIPVEVYDVAGAGDTVVALLGALLAVGSPIEPAAALANIAASWVIQKPGVVPITRQELITYLSTNKEPGNHHKIKTGEELEKIVKDLKKEGRKIVFTNGCFDILHVGHIRLLNEARKYGDVLIVGINSDSSVRKLKGENRPINGERERAELLAALGAVDYVTIFDEETPREILRKLRVHTHIKGGDYSAESLPEAGVVRRYGGKIVILPYIEGYSTSTIISKIRNV
jgi:D-beta-D-heptose 7-phosphate kinase / D-beta-D-heptose 1-phosphate adenosyltransferase